MWSDRIWSSISLAILSGIVSWHWWNNWANGHDKSGWEWTRMRRQGLSLSRRREILMSRLIIRNVTFTVISGVCQALNVLGIPMSIPCQFTWEKNHQPPPPPLVLSLHQTANESFLKVKPIRFNWNVRFTFFCLQSEIYDLAGLYFISSQCLSTINIHS